MKFKLSEDDSLAFDRKLRALRLEEGVNEFEKEVCILDGEMVEASIFYEDMPKIDFDVTMPYSKKNIKIYGNY